MSNSYDSTYRQQKPLSSRLKVEQPMQKPDKVKQHPPVKAKREPLPQYMHPVKSSGKSQGIEEGSAGDIKDYLLSSGDSEAMTPQEMHLCQMYVQGNDEALDAL